MITARFDDLTPGSELSFRLVRPTGEVRADRPQDVPGALEALEEAVRGGRWAAGFVAYEAASGLDPALAVRPRPGHGPLGDLPLVWFGLFEDREELPSPEPTIGAIDEAPAWSPSIDRARFDAAIAAIRERIAAGDTYQVNHTFRLRARFEGDEDRFYRDLCLAQRSGYAAHLAIGRYAVLSASPELFFQIRGARITTRPMKGTAPRGRWPGEDAEAARRLTSSKKDRAENAMIVDLLRSDLGRIARPGSVRVERLFEPERYETVWQLTSTVSALLRPEVTLRDVFAALFPSGSVTGAPKVATTHIIRELEDSPRGVYCGAIGCLAPEASGEPSATFNVAIRTVLLDRGSGTAEYGVGGGITYDSSAAGEYHEALTKARVLTARRPAFELLETLRHDRAAGFRHLEEHLDRMAGSAGYFGFALDPHDLHLALEKARAELGGRDGVVRVLLARDGAVRAETAPPPPPSPEPVRVALDTDPVDPRDVWLFHKTTLREPYERRREARADVDDVLLVNNKGEVTESCVANLAVRLPEGWVTPPVGCGLLAGTFRTVLLREGRVLERPVLVDEMRRAEEIALVSSVRGWRTARLVP
ncbi:MAG TPA: aminodeoxychorismate synthase component I [Actinomycetota bacterium]